jgi:hypothetical protein
MYTCVARKDYQGAAAELGFSGPRRLPPRRPLPPTPAPAPALAPAPTGGGAGALSGVVGGVGCTLRRRPPPPPPLLPPSPPDSTDGGTGLGGDAAFCGVAASFISAEEAATVAVARGGVCGGWDEVGFGGVSGPKISISVSGTPIFALCVATAAFAVSIKANTWDAWLGWSADLYPSNETNLSDERIQCGQVLSMYTHAHSDGHAHACRRAHVCRMEHAQRCNA